MSITFPRRPDMRRILDTARFSPLMLIVVAALSGVVALAGAFAAYAILAPDRAAPASANVDWKAPLPSVDDLGPPRLASGDTQIITRPIFNKDRRPAAKTAAAAPASAVPLSDTPTGLKVSAIVKHRHDRRAFVSGANGQGEWKTVGEKVDEWTISDIASEDVTVSNGVATARIQLYSDKPVPDDPLAAQKQPTAPERTDAPNPDDPPPDPEPVPEPPTPTDAPQPPVPPPPQPPPHTGSTPDVSNRQMLRRAPP